MTDDWLGPRRELTRKDIDAVLAFLPFFEQPEAAFAEGRSMAPEVHSFMVALYEHHWMYPFSWSTEAWQRQMFALLDDPERLNKARLETLRKILITYARADRLCEGALVEACERGHVLAILRRVKQIRDKKYPSPS